MSHEVVDALVALLGAPRVAAAPDDPRICRHVSGASIGRPLALVSPRNAAECAAVTRLAAASGLRVVPLADATTFWDPVRIDRSIVVDARRFDDILELDVPGRCALVSANTSVRSLDRAARAHGLCLPAYPDTDGMTSIGSMVGVGTTAGLGLGHGFPVDFITGVEFVTSAGTILTAGSMRGVGTSAAVAAGLPDLLGLICGSQGALGVVTRARVRLSPAPWLAEATCTVEQGLDTTQLLAILDSLRSGFDHASMDSARVELLGDATTVRATILLRSHSSESAEQALEFVTARAGEVRAAVPTLAQFETHTETAAARAGQLPEYDWRFCIPPGEHRQRLGTDAFWGAEVTAAWGDSTVACVSTCTELFSRLASLSPSSRRLGLYPSALAVSVGTQASVNPDARETLVKTLQASLPALRDAGGTPYRTGSLWQETLATTEVLSGAIVRAVSSSDEISDHDATQVELIDAIEHAFSSRAPVRCGPCTLQLAVGDGRIRLNAVPETHVATFVSGDGVGLTYKLDGVEQAEDRQVARQFLEAIAAFFMSGTLPIDGFVSLVGQANTPLRVPRSLLVDPPTLRKTITALHEQLIETQRHAATVVDLPPCLALAARPIDPAPRRRPVRAGLSQPCSQCGAASHCELADLVSLDRDHRPLRNSPGVAATYAYLDALAEAFNTPLSLSARALVGGLVASPGRADPSSRPFEFSLSFVDGALSPRLRVVDYGPKHTRPERRQEVLRTLEQCAPSVVTPATKWLDAVDHGGEVAIGFDIGLDGADLRIQLYALCDPTRDAGPLIARAAAQAGSSHAIGPLTQFASGSDRGVAILGLTLDPSGPDRTTKIYVKAPLNAVDSSLGVAPAAFGIDAALASWGLAVFTLTTPGPVFLKWDAPVTTHFQLVRPALRAFVQSLAPSHEEPALRLLEHDRFAAWPTWVSRNPRGGTVYFVPR